jgi:hypothetical protein
MLDYSMAGGTSNLATKGSKAMQSLIMKRDPFRLADKPNVNVQKILENGKYAMGNDGIWRPRAPKFFETNAYRPSQQQGDSVRNLSLSDLFEIQQPNVSDAINNSVLNRPISDAIGLGNKTQNKAIIPSEGRPTYLPPAVGSHPSVLRSFFQGGINPGKYTSKDSVFALNARKNEGYARPNIPELINAIKGRVRTIITDVPTPDVGPVQSDTAIDDVLSSAGYTMKEPGIWELTDKIARNAFIGGKNAPTNVRPSMPESIPMPDFLDTILRNGKKVPRTPDYYDKNWITNDLPSWTNKGKK